MQKVLALFTFNIADLPALHLVRRRLLDLVLDPPVRGSREDGAARHPLPRARQHLQQRALHGAVDELLAAERDRHVPRRLHLHGLFRAARVRHRALLHKRKIWLNQLLFYLP